MCELATVQTCERNNGGRHSILAQDIDDSFCHASKNGPGGEFLFDRGRPWALLSILKPPGTRKRELKNAEIQRVSQITVVGPGFHLVESE